MKITIWNKKLQLKKKKLYVLFDSISFYSLEMLFMIFWNIGSLSLKKNRHSYNFYYFKFNLNINKNLFFANKR